MMDMICIYQLVALGLRYVEVGAEALAVALHVASSRLSSQMLSARLVFPA